MQKKGIWTAVFITILLVLSTSLGIKKYTSQTKKVSVVERTQAQVKEDVHELLNKFYPKSAYIVTVRADLSNQRETFSEKLDPKRTTVQRDEEYTADIAPVFSSRPSSAALRNLFQKGMKLPGLVAEKTMTRESLPGFPNILQEQQIGSSDSLPSTPKGQVNAVQFTTTQDHVYYDKNTTKTTTPKDKINQIHIQVVLDKASARLEFETTQELDKLIQSLSAFNKKRGDTVHISFKSFKGTFFVYQNFMLRHQKLFVGFKKFFQKFDLLIVILLVVVPILCGVVFGFYKIYRYLKDKHELMKSERKKVIDYEVKKNRRIAAKQTLVYKKKKNELSELAQDKPEAIAHYIVGWLKEDTIVRKEP